MGNLITGIDSFKELAAAVRSGNACIPVTKVAGGDERIPDSCFGLLVVEGDETELRLRSSTRMEPVAVMEVLMLYSEYRPAISRLLCTFDGNLHVVVRHCVVSSSCPSERGTSCNLKFVTIEGETDRCEDNKADHILMVGKIDRSQLHFNNLSLITTSECSLTGYLGDSMKRTGFGGDVPPYRYVIREEGPDLSIEVSLLEGQVSQSIDSDRKFMDALIVSLVWVNGGHAGRYYSCHWRNGDLINAEIHPLQNVTRCRPRLIQPTFALEEATKIMRCGIEFFREASPLSSDLKLLLWQYRDATAEGPVGLSMLLQSCTLLEGVAGLTLRHAKNLSNSAIDLLRMPGDTSTSKRQSTAAERFFHAGTHLGFDWEQEFLPVVNTWKRVRNALAHGDIAKYDFRNPNETLDNYRQIIQAFNALTIRLIGYNERVRMGDGWYPTL